MLRYYQTRVLSGRDGQQDPKKKRNNFRGGKKAFIFYSFFFTRLSASAPASPGPRQRPDLPRRVQDPVSVRPYLRGEGGQDGGRRLRGERPRAQGVCDAEERGDCGDPSLRQGVHGGRRGGQGLRGAGVGGRSRRRHRRRGREHRGGCERGGGGGERQLRLLEQQLVLVLMMKRRS